LGGYEPSQESHKLLPLYPNQQFIEKFTNDMRDNGLMPSKMATCLVNKLIKYETSSPHSKVRPIPILKMLLVSAIG